LAPDGLECLQGVADARVEPDDLLLDTGAAGPGDTVWLALRPEKIGLSGERPTGALNAVSGTVSEIGYRGDVSIYKVRLADRSLMKVALANVSAPGKNSYGAGDLVWLSWRPDAGVVLTR